MRPTRQLGFQLLGAWLVATGLFSLLPVAVPGLIAATIFAFTISWSGFLYPLAFIFSSDQQVLTAGTVTSLIKGDVYHWGGLMAGALLACLPPVLLYVFLMDYYISGLTAGSTKG